MDDAKIVRTLAQKALAAFDCDVNEAPNGFNALFAMEKALPDLILLDVNMPVMGGLEMLTMMRSNPALQAIPVIILASPADHAVLPRIHALGVSAIVTKPFAATDLVEKVLRVLALKPLQPAPRQPA